MQKIINKIKQWKEAVDNYDKAAINAAKITSQLSEARNGSDNWKVEDLQTEYKESLSEIEQRDEVARKLHAETIVAASDEIDDKDLRRLIIQLLMSEADFAGLDEKAIKAIESNESAIETVAYVHQIYIEHSKMIADKAIGLLKD